MINSNISEMKVIVSHDVDHITAWEHKKNLILPKFLMRNALELIIKQIGLSEYLSRYKIIFNNKWQNLAEIMEFDRQNAVPSTFFLAVNNGLGLSYPIKDTEYWLKRILLNGFKVGVHGIACDSYESIKNEFETFNQIAGSNEQAGIRIHYLRCNDHTLSNLSNVGYTYDSSLLRMINPFRVDKMWEFPLHIMDGYFICRNSRWQNQSFCEAKENTKKILEELYNKNIKYITILFHDCYFSDSFRTWKEWYIWLVDYLKINKVVFISYTDAVKELDSNDE